MVIHLCRSRFLSCPPSKKEGHIALHVSVGMSVSLNLVQLIMRIKNDLEFQIGRYQSRAICFDIILTEAFSRGLDVKACRPRLISLILFLAEY